MVYPVTGTRPSYSGNFIPEIWAGKLVQNLYDTTVLSAIANTDYEGEITKHGDTVNIRTTPAVTLRPYIKGQSLVVENPDRPRIQLHINRGDYFNVVEDDVDRIQSDINLINMWTRDASERMKIAVDTAVLQGLLPDIAATNRGATAGVRSAVFNLGTTGTPVALTAANVLNFLVDVATVLDEANVPESGRYMVIPARMAGLIKKSDLRNASISGDGTSILRNGRLGEIDRFELFMSHNLLVAGTGVAQRFHVIAGHKEGLTFAMQMETVQRVQSEMTFGTLIRGLQVYGFRVVMPEALAEAVVTIAV